MIHTRLAPLAALALGVAPASAQTQLPIAPERMPFVVVGDPGNPGDTGGLGRVSYTYLIGKTEVTNREYAELLNAKARLSDPFELFDSEMTFDPRGGILRAGSGTPADPYRYAPKPDMAQKPVNFVSLFDAMRYVNWIENGRGAGDTESGSYTLLGGLPIPTNGDTVTRDPGALHSLPTESEWHKAGHYDPTGFIRYWTYATRSHQVPAIATATATGEVANPGPNVVNYASGADWGGLDGHLTSVGSAETESFYGCRDMNGNVGEWTEDVFVWSGLFYRVNRGGSFALDESIMQRGHFLIVRPFVEADWAGFRIVRRR